MNTDGLFELAADRASKRADEERLRIDEDATEEEHESIMSRIHAEELAYRAGALFVINSINNAKQAGEVAG